MQFGCCYHISLFFFHLLFFRIKTIFIGFVVLSPTCSEFFIIVHHNFVFIAVMLYWVLSVVIKSLVFLSYVVFFPPNLRLIGKMAFTFQSPPIWAHQVKWVMLYIKKKQVKGHVNAISLFFYWKLFCILYWGREKQKKQNKSKEKNLKHPKNQHAFWFFITKVADGAILDMLEVTSSLCVLCRHCGCHAINIQCFPSPSSLS